jgi:hypothetical protein
MAAPVTTARVAHLPAGLDRELRAHAARRPPGDHRDPPPDPTKPFATVVAGQTKLTAS